MSSLPRALAPIVAAIVPAVSAAQRPPVAQTLDLAVSRPPETVRIEGRDHLVWELHLASFLRQGVAIRRITVTAGAPDAPLAGYEGAALARILGRPGPRVAEETRAALPPGGRAVAYFWIALPEGATPPQEVKHRIEMTLEGAAETATFESAAIAVAGAAPLVLDPPLRGGPWVAAYDPALVGGHRTVYYTIGGKARIPGRFAIDWIKVPAGGAIVRTTPPPPDWNGLGEPVLAVADAVVAAALDDLPDNTGEPDASAHRPENASGNYIALDLGDGRFVFYEHLRHGSLAVKPGDRVRRGQVIARLGNSGSTSSGPHLHFHVADANSPLGAEGLPFVLSGFERLGAFASITALVNGERWMAAPDGPSRRTGERPAPNAVVRFP